MRLTALAQLIEIHMAAGITATADLSEKTGYSERAIRKAKAELGCQTALECRHWGADGTGVPEPECRSAPGCRSEMENLEPAYIATHATNEYPTDIVITRKLVASSALPENQNEIEGLNGHTSMYVDWLAEWLSPYSPDRDAARSILVSNIDLYTAPKVKAGMVELKALIASGEKPRNLVKSFSAFIKNANTAATPKPTAKSKAEARYATAMAALETVGVH